jgi:hypothetical protein
MKPESSLFAFALLSAMHRNRLKSRQPTGAVQGADVLVIEPQDDDPRWPAGGAVALPAERVRGL